jgi:hypothetical protein
MHACTQRSDYDKTQDARNKATYMTFVGAGGAVIVCVGVFLILTSKGKPITIEKTAVTPVIGPDQIGFAIGGTL